MDGPSPDLDDETREYAQSLFDECAEDGLEPFWDEDGYGFQHLCECCLEEGERNLAGWRFDQPEFDEPDAARGPAG